VFAKPDRARELSGAGPAPKGLTGDPQFFENFAESNVLLHLKVSNEKPGAWPGYFVQ
jgi:hypothetical protein